MQRTDGSPTFRYTAGGATPDPESRLGELSPEVIACLIAVMRGEPAGAKPSTIVETIGEGGRFTDDAVLTIQGADGDPEMEWEDVAQVWAAHPDSAAALAGWTRDDVLAAIDELRDLAGSGHDIRVEAIE